VGIYKAVISTWADGVNAEDAIQITPTFRTETGESGLDSLAQEILDKWQAYISPTFASNQQRVTLYVAGGVKPNYPVAQKEENLGQGVATTLNRDIALCLSYYSQFNRPRFRGRLYLPCAIAGISVTGARPSTTQQQKAADLASVLAGVGGTNVTWGLWSTVDKVFRPTTHWWVDNAWDTQRRRGQKPTSRLEGAIAG